MADRQVCRRHGASAGCRLGGTPSPRPHNAIALARHPPARHPANLGRPKPRSRPRPSRCDPQSQGLRRPASRHAVSSRPQANPGLEYDGRVSHGSPIDVTVTLPPCRELLEQRMGQTSSAAGQGNYVRPLVSPAPRAPWRTTPASVSRWEAGLRSPRGETALKYAKLLARRALELKAIGLTKR
jgi:hypothetical protein